MLNALMKESEKSVRNAIAQFVGILMKHNTNNDWMVQVLNFVFQHVSSSDPHQSEVSVQRTFMQKT